MVRKIDKLGRIVIPKEICRTLEIAAGDSLEFLVEGERICLRKRVSADKKVSVRKALHNVVDGINELMNGCTFKQSVCYLKALKVIQTEYEKYTEKGKSNVYKDK